MVLWKFKCYDDGQSPNLWQRWYKSNIDYQGSHDAIFEIIEQQQSWTNPYYTKAMGDDLIEVRLNGAVQWRIFGFYGDKRREFVVVAIGYHKQNVYYPKAIKETAKKIIGAIKSGIKKANDCERPN